MCLRGGDRAKFPAETGDSVWATGWGAHKGLVGEDGEQSSDLKEAEMFVMEDFKEQELVGALGRPNAAGLHDSTCHGDSGGPLQFTNQSDSNDHAWYHYAITVSGTDPPTANPKIQQCGSGGVAVFARTNRYTGSFYYVRTTNDSFL